jgi:hypothetical protein
MATSFTIISGNTVPSNYSWDFGAPFTSTSPLVSTNILPVDSIITGYAPGVKVFINNDSTPATTTPEATAISSTYSWDFGDHYNNKNNNYTTSCSGSISHVYIMPGTYSITLTRTDTKQIFDPVSKSIKSVITQELASQNNVVVVQNILPVAQLYPVTSLQGSSPHTVRLTARTTKPGSFPIDKIIWDFGDGSPLLTVSRYATAVNSQLLQSNTYNQDLADPRNYDPIHTYQRSYNEYAVFYPSITAYSSSTGDFDTCSTTIGPISLPNLNQIKILKNKSTNTGSFYAIKADNNLTFVKTLTAPITQTNTTRIPSNPLRGISTQPILYSGNVGANYYTVNVSVTC